MSNERNLNPYPVAVILTLLMIFTGCSIASSYRPAAKKTIRDFTGTDAYRKTIGILALSDTTIFTSPQITSPFMEAFRNGLKSTAPGVRMRLPEETDDASFLWHPPRIKNGDIDVFRLSAQARKAGMNAVVSPILMDIRVSKKDTGFWFFREVEYILQIQTAATIYDAITGARLDLEILTEKIDIDQQKAESIGKGQEVQVPDLVGVAEKMGENLGERMGDAIDKSKWLVSVIAVEDGTCMIAVGSDVGIDVGDRFSVLDGSQGLTGLDGQRFVVPGPKIGEVTVRRVTPRQAFCSPESGPMPAVGSILVPGT